MATMFDFTVEVSPDTDTVELSDEEIRRKYEEGGFEAVRDYVQAEIDNFVNNKVVAVALDHEVQAASERDVYVARYGQPEE